MLGVLPGGLVWLLGTPELVRGDCAVRLLRDCRGIIQELLKRYPILGNKTWVGNHVHHRWLEWMGFRIDRRNPVTIGGVDHFYFHISSKG